MTANTAMRALSASVLLAFALGETALCQARPDPTTGEIVPTECLVLRLGGGGGPGGPRTGAAADPVYAALVSGDWKAPSEGDTVQVEGRPEQRWERVTVDEDGSFAGTSLRGGYAYFPIEVPEAGVWILSISSDSIAFVNGEPHAGDVYGYGYVEVPVALHAGTNDLLVQGGRGSAKVKLVPPAHPGMLSDRDTTLPDMIVGEAVDTWAAVMLTNASRGPLLGCRIRATLPGAPPVETPLPYIQALSTRKVGFRIASAAPEEPGAVPLKIDLVRGGGDGERIVDALRIKLQAVTPLDVQKRTFISDIDGSVQYYGVQPAHPVPGDGRPPALVLSVHGAGVEARGQAAAYSPKTWAHIVAPTNRRPYGFDWEDWGRTDAMEVLAHAKALYGTDPSRTYLTGHSMGGHGAWHIGLTFPDQFAGIGPSAGWVSWLTYAGRGGRQPVEEGGVPALLRRCMSPSDTIALSHNCGQQGVYVLHGEADDNVPVTEARMMRDELQPWHKDFRYHEQPGAGHWWDSSDEPGTDCVDWAPMFDMFARHTLPADTEVRQVDFITASPGVSASCNWARIEAQVKQLDFSKISIRWDTWSRRFVGTTENVARLALSLKQMAPGDPVSVDIDGQKLGPIPWPAGEPTLWLVRDGETWYVGERPSPALKGPARCGGIKSAFGHRVVLVYGTAGTPEENAAAFAKARFDHETFWYRGNASLDVIPDTAFDPASEPDRNVVLYGNAAANLAWKALLDDSPVQVAEGAVTVGTHTLAGDDFGCLFVRPRPGSDVAVVGAVAGTGPKGIRVLTKIPYLSPGSGLPDCIVLGPDAAARGTNAAVCAGFFGIDWSIETGEFAGL